MAITIFKIARWVSVLALLATFMFSYVQISNVLFLFCASAFFVSFIIVVFYKCPSCEKSFSTKVGFISFCWPYTGYCQNCGQPLNNENT